VYDLPSREISHLFEERGRFDLKARRYLIFSRPFPVRVTVPAEESAL
jgi:hypothetical protein